MEQRPAIFKLNLDCFDHVFDYLALKDLSQFSQTCKAMKWAVGEYYQTNYETIDTAARILEDDLYLHDETIGYSDFVQKLHIMSHLSIIPGIKCGCVVKRDLCKKVTELAINTVGFTNPGLHRLEYIINNAEVLAMSCFYLKMDTVFYETVPSMCNSLKRLHMLNFQYYDAAQTQDGNKWLLREYPTLEHLEWTQSEEHGYKINEIKAFFELNPNVRSFATNVNCLWESRQLIIESGVKLDDLTIDLRNTAYKKNPSRIRDICILLNELYEKGVYKRLHLRFTGYYDEPDNQVIQQIIDQITPINAVRSMVLPRINANSLMFVNLVELHLDYGNREVILDIDVMAKYLVNLERVDFEHAHLKEMLSFIYHSVKLKKLRVVDFLDENESVLDLANMNKRREQLLDASNVIIFISGWVYLATKWASTLTDFRLIEMRRSTAHRWGHHFGRR